MFMDFRDQPPPPRWEPKPAGRPPLSRRERRAIGWIIGFNVLMLLCAPLAGATLFEGLAALLR